MEFKGKTVIVTGAGKGIGREIVRMLAGRGAYIVALTRSAADVDALRGEFAAGQSRSISPTPMRPERLSSLPFPQISLSTAPARPSFSRFSRQPSKPSTVSSRSTRVLR